jgi:signal transduction histidine kinase
MKDKIDPHLSKEFNIEVRKLKAVITFVIYGLLLLLLWTMYDTLVAVPNPSISAIITILAFLLVFIIFLFNRFSKNVIQRITVYTAAIEDARRYAEAIVDSVRYPLLVLDSELRVLSANRSFYNTFKAKPGETEGKILYELGDSQWDLPQLRELLESLEPGNITFDDFEVKIHFPFIGYRVLLLSARQVFSEGKKMFLFSIVDITALKNAEAELKKRSHQLEDADKAKSDFLANMSHELRTPLNAIIGFSEVLKDGLIGVLTDKQKDYVSDIFKSGQHLLSLINDILDLSKIEAGKMSLELEEVNLPVFFESSLSIIKEKAHAHAIELGLDVDESLGDVFVDTRKFKQIVYNLLSNAVKFTPDGGKVTVRARRLSVPTSIEEPEYQMSEEGDELIANNPGEFVEFSVEDTGIGISEKEQQRLFQPFEQLDSSTGRKYEGTGLGLTMVKRLAELHGGTVDLTSEVGKGSCFTVTIPYRVDRRFIKDRRQGSRRADEEADEVGTSGTENEVQDIQPNTPDEPDIPDIFNIPDTPDKPDTPDAPPKTDDQKEPDFILDLEKLIKGE